MRNYVIINGVNSNTINGLAINELPPITKPPMRVLQEEIDGRDGDITTNLGYGAYDKVMTIGLFHTFDINQIIAFFNGTGTIVFSNEPDKKYNYKIIEQIDYEKLISFKTATVTLHCQPFKYPLEETPLIIEPTIDTLENVTSASIETNENTLSTTLKGNTSQYTTTGANVLESIATSNTTNIYEDVLWAEGLQANTTYTFQFVGVVGNRISGNANLFTTDTYHNITSGINTMTLTTKSDISTSTGSQYTSGKGWRIFKNAKSGNVANVFTDVMANVGSTALPYEPYTGGNPAPNPSYPEPINVVTGDNEVVVCGKNILKLIKDDTTGGSYDETTQTYTSTTRTGTSCWVFKTLATELNYTFSISSLSNAEYRYCFSDEDVTGSSNIATLTNTSGGTITNGAITVSNNSNKKYLYVSFRVTTQGLTGSLVKPMLEKSNSSTSYEPYQSQTYPISLGSIELCKIGDYQDYIYKENDNWYIHKEIGKARIPDLTGWNYVMSGLRSIFYTNALASTILIPPTSQILPVILATHYIPATQTSTWVNGNIAIRNSSGTGGDAGNIIIVNNAYNNTTDFLNASSNSYIYYALATPTNTIITDTELISQLEALKGATTYYGITNINQQNNDLPFIMDLSYMVKDTDKVIVDNIGNIYSKPTIALEGNGTGGIYLNDNQVFNVTLTDKMTISISDMEAYNPDTHALLNRDVTGNYNSMTLQPNENTIKITGGITKVTITNYTRYL